jgi:isoquinoline 1-oxidoreductase beta subunit
MLAINRDLPRPSRRQFLVGAAAAGAGLTIGFHVPLGPVSRALAADKVNPINVYLRIGPDGTVTVLSAHMDGGQGIYTGIATLVAEELDADWSQLRVEGAAGNPKLYGNVTWGGAVQGTGGSSSIPSSWERYRHAGAVARAMLVEAAAQEWGVPAGEVRVERGVIRPCLGQVGQLRRSRRSGGGRDAARRGEAEGSERLGLHRQREAAPARFDRQDHGRAAVPH